MLSEIVNFHTEGSLKHPLFINTLSSWRQNYQILLKFSYLKSSFTFPNRNSELQCVRALHFITTAGVIIWHIGLGFVITTSYNSKGNSRNIHWKHSSMSTTFEQCSLRMKKKNRNTEVQAMMIFLLPTIKFWNSRKAFLDIIVSGK